tara:strand:+ start:246 stop:656 length:411 start_codon:yes stop_codon:yes gene_type:complete
MPTKEIYSSLNVRQFKNLLDLVDSDENKDNIAIILKFGATWCGPCKTIYNQCHTIFNTLPDSVVCFDLDIDEDEVMELYLAYKQKKMVTSVPTIFAYVSNPERNKQHWYAPDFSVNSAKPTDIQNFFAKVQTIVNK